MSKRSRPLSDCLRFTMETWFLILIALCVSFLLRPLLSLFLPTSISRSNLPPGPRFFHIIEGFLFLLKSTSELEPIIRKLQAEYGPIISLPIGSRSTVFVADRSPAHQALILNGAVFADRPQALATNKCASSNQHTIASAVYGPTWRLLRRNITSEILHPSRVKSYGSARKWVLDILVNRLKTEYQSHSEAAAAGVRVVDHFQYAMFCLLVLMCFGDKLNEEQIKEIEHVQRQLLLSSGRFNILNFKPKLTKIIFKNRWRQFFKILEERREVLVPLIRARQNRAKQGSKTDDKDDEFVLSYTDTLLDLELPDGNEKRKLSEGEMVSLCSEFLTAGTDTTSTALQWIMANVVKYPQVQDKLFAEIKGVMGETEDEVREEVLHKLPYLKAVILEGLRRHPPAHFVPRAVTHDVVLGGYVVPKNGSVSFMVADIGWDPQVWEDPMAFKPERFLGSGGEEGFDLRGSREIKMMPFGAGRRICPGSGLAVLHLEYFVANLVWKFEWRTVEGDDVDLSEKQEFTIVMKNPLHAHVIPRI
ncbi:cytochrome P450 89A2-like [Malus sylvestris]|uniref:cytochrome P450 89A2-like n=1 Tax=Malus sylvestris TaxID=3752 RepID=UPI0021ACB1DA|nr:cytochrome P450 89A2-like [Malus sylvestris]